MGSVVWNVCSSQQPGLNPTPNPQSCSPGLGFPKAVLLDGASWAPSMQSRVVSAGEGAQLAGWSLGTVSLKPGKNPE